MRREVSRHSTNATRLTLNRPFEVALNELATALERAGFDVMSVELGPQPQELAPDIAGRVIVLLAPSMIRMLPFAMAKLTS